MRAAALAYWAFERLETVPKACDTLRRRLFELPLGTAVFAHIRDRDRSSALGLSVIHVVLDSTAGCTIQIRVYR